MKEITKHINDTNASFRDINAGDAKNTDLFLDNDQFTFFEGIEPEEQITVRFDKDNLSQAILFIASILPRKYDNSAVHKKINFSKEFVIESLQKLDGFFTDDGMSVQKVTQKWTVRINTPKKNGTIDNRFYLNGLFKEYTYKDITGNIKKDKFTIRNYLAGGYSDLHIIKNEDGIYDVRVTNALTPINDGREDGIAIIDNQESEEALPLQIIYYGAPGTGKSHTIQTVTKGKKVIRTTFHPDSDYSTFVGAYKPTTKESYVRDSTGRVVVENGEKVTEERIVYTFVEQAFLQAYVNAWKLYTQATDGNNPEPQFLIIEEINRGNCAQIFGDLFQLLDRNVKGFSEYPIMSDKDIQKQLCKAFSDLQLTNEDSLDEMYDESGMAAKIKSGEVLVLPCNLFIWATMNTSDQSLFPIDSAFKRRWDWKYIPISQGIDKETGNKLSWKIKVNGTCYDWWSFLQKINDIIGNLTSSQDKKLGFFFCKAKDGIIDSETFTDKVLFFLWNEVLKDYEKEQEFLLNGNTYLTFDDFYSTDDNGKTVICEDKVEKLLLNLHVDVSDCDVIPNDIDESSNPSGGLYKKFWDAFNETYDDSGDYKKKFFNRKGLDQSWMDLGGLGRKYYLCLIVLSQKKVARIQLYFSNGETEYQKYVDHIEEMKESLKTDIISHEAKKSKYLQIEIPFDINSDEWSKAFQWYHEKAVAMSELCNEIDPK
jgi:hypothetical protein